MESFVTKTCGLANTEAPCHCHKQLPALAHQASTSRAGHTKPLIAIRKAELQQAERAFDALVRVGNAAAVFRAHPDYQAPDNQLAAIRAVLRAEGFWGDDRATH
jgi:hypothetical protein